MIDTADSFSARVRFGTKNPERVEHPVWLEAVRNNWSAWRLRGHCGDAQGDGDAPFWSWRRYGRTSTHLPDGRIVHIGGGHEASYDPDFCIYNDVVVERPSGQFDFYLYPRDLFPPTDFHSATMLGDWIYLVGSLGYLGARGNAIQVMRLDLNDVHIERVETLGEVPGWLSHHCAERLDDARILIVGGEFVSDNTTERNKELFELNVTTRLWRRRAHGDMSLFPISRELYDACKSPRVGRANPEKADNPFWREMAKRRWTPSRARLHYGDFGPDDPSRPPTREEIDALPPDTMLPRKPMDGPKVWSACRTDAAHVLLDDGRRLQIGGVIRHSEDDFENEWPDEWSYADVIVDHGNGEIDIFVFPAGIFPPLWPFCAVTRPGCVLLFGDTDRSAGREHSYPVVLRLDLQSFEIRIIDEGGAPPRTLFAVECHRVVGDYALFELARDRSDEPRRWAIFDLADLCWRYDSIPYDAITAPGEGTPRL